MFFISLAAAGRDWSHLNFARRIASPPEAELETRRLSPGDPFEGDILLTPAQLAAELGDPERRRAFEDKKWHTGNQGRMWVPYKFGPTVLSDPWGPTTAVKAAQEAIEAATCVRFKVRTDEDDYLHIVRGDAGVCSSWVGRQGGSQELWLGEGCWTKGIAIHELMHALGFWHEQSRPDRDNYVDIAWQNIEAGAEGNFQKHGGAATMNHPYDYGSIMHYGAHQFGHDGQQTIHAKPDPGLTPFYALTQVAQRTALMGNREEMSNWDIADLNRALCPTQCTCDTPQAGTAGHNKIRCLNIHMPAGWCASNEECYRTDWVEFHEKHLLCRVP